MYLFIFESIGTTELILIGAVALIIFGPRKLPQMAKTIGKTMAEFRNTTNEFKSTWEREVSFEETRPTTETTIPKQTNEPLAISAGENPTPNEQSKPEIREIDSAQFGLNHPAETRSKKIVSDPVQTEKQNWL